MSKKLQQTKKEKKRVTWNPEGISKARLFVIEPWRRMNRKPLSSIRENDQSVASPFTFPSEVPYIEPYFDYSTYVKPRSFIGCCSSSIKDKPNRPTTRSLTNSELLPRSRTISLTEVYEIVERIKESNLIEKNNHSIDPLKERLDNDVLDLYD